MISAFLMVLSFSAGLAIGLYHRYLDDRIKRLEEPEPPTGVTLGAEAPMTAVQSQSASIVEPKTPQRLAWEAEQKLNAQNGIGNLKPNEEYRVHQ